MVDSASPPFEPTTMHSLLRRVGCSSAFRPDLVVSENFSEGKAYMLVQMPAGYLLGRQLLPDRQLMLAFAVPLCIRLTRACMPCSISSVKKAWQEFSDAQIQPDLGNTSTDEQARLRAVESNKGNVFDQVLKAAKQQNPKFQQKKPTQKPKATEVCSSASSLWAPGGLL